MFHDRLNKYEKLMVQIQKSYLTIRHDKYGGTKLVDLVTLKEYITIMDYGQELVFLYPKQ